MTDPARSRQTPFVTPVSAPDFRGIYESEFAYVYRTLERLGARAADVEDLAHDVFVVVHRKLAEYDPARPLKPWLFGIAYRVASDDRRRARHASEVPTETIEVADAAPAADEQIAARQARELVLAALTGLDLDQRAVFVMHDLDGCPAPEIAAALGAPVNTIYSRLRLAREKFAAAVRRLGARRGEP